MTMVWQRATFVRDRTRQVALMALIREQIMDKAKNVTQLFSKWETKNVNLLISDGIWVDSSASVVFISKAKHFWCREHFNDVIFASVADMIQQIDKWIFASIIQTQHATCCCCCSNFKLEELFRTSTKIWICTFNWNFITTNIMIIK